MRKPELKPGQVMRHRARSGMGWSPEEKAELEFDFRQGASIDRLADQHERSGGAICSMLCQVRLLVRDDVHHCWVRREVTPYITWREVAEYEIDERSID